MDLKQLIADYLEEARMMQVATSNDNQPWVSTLYFAYDENWNFYWISLPTTKHSQQIRSNEKIAGTIVIPQKPGDPVRGLQFEGTAKELTDKKDIEEAMNHYAARMGTKKERVDKIIEGVEGHVSYKITPTLFVLFDTTNFPDNPRQEYKLK